MKESGLERWLNYDRWAQNAFRLLVFGREKTHNDCESVRLEEDPILAGGVYEESDLSKEGVSLASSTDDWSARKTFSLSRTKTGFDIACDVTLQRKAQVAAAINAGIEVVVNFLAPSASDRYFESGGKRFPLRWSGAVPASQLRVVDEWQKAAATIVAPNAREFWICPIETVSESEDGFERIYQGSKIVTVWPADLSPGREWRAQLTLQVAQLG